MRVQCFDGPRAGHFYHWPTGTPHFQVNVIDPEAAKLGRWEWMGCIYRVRHVMAWGASWPMVVGELQDIVRARY